MSNTNNPLDTAIKAYSKGSLSPDMPQARQVPQGMSLLETTTLGYKLNQREAENKKKPAKSSLVSLYQKLPEQYLGLLLAPPTREEARYLPRDIQTLMTDLEQANKGINSIPQMEQKIKDINSQMDVAMQNREVDTYNNLKMSLEREEASLGKVKGFVDNTIAAAKSYQQNNPNEIAKANDTLKMLRTELSAPYTLSEAKDALPTHKKSVVQWLDDVRNKPAIEDRLQAQKVLEHGGLDAKAILTEVDRQGLSLTDQAILEMRDEEGSDVKKEA